MRKLKFLQQIRFEDVTLKESKSQSWSYRFHQPIAGLAIIKFRRIPQTLAGINSLSYPVVESSPPHMSSRSSCPEPGPGTGYLSPLPSVWAPVYSSLPRWCCGPHCCSPRSSSPAGRCLQESLPGSYIKGRSVTDGGKRSL